MRAAAISALSFDPAVSFGGVAALAVAGEAGTALGAAAAAGASAAAAAAVGEATVGCSCAGDWPSAALRFFLLIERLLQACGATSRARARRRTAAPGRARRRSG